jgi:hypothetical protein
VVPERGVDRAGLDEQDADAVLADLVVQGLGVALDRVCCRSFRVSVAASSLVSAGDGRRPRAA